MGLFKQTNKHHGGVKKQFGHSRSKKLNTDNTTDPEKE